jgi:hypothetical protein
MKGEPTTEDPVKTGSAIVAASLLIESIALSISAMPTASDSAYPRLKANQ